MRNKIVAVTGGIGSGKSTVCKSFKNLGCLVFSADEIYSELLKDKSFVKEIYSALGIQSDNLNFNRELVSKKVFNDSTLLKKLNSVTHDKIMRKMLDLSKSSTSENGVVINEVPLLFESGYQDLYDTVIVVERDLSKRLQAIISRDNLTEEEALKRINNQFNYDKLDKSTYTIIDNSKDENSLLISCKVVLDEIIND